MSYASSRDARQASLFAGPDPVEPPVSAPPTPETMAPVVRPTLIALLDTIRGAATMPWDARTTRYHATVFPQMANWLPTDERDRLRAEFGRHLSRLGYSLGRG